MGIIIDENETSIKCLEESDSKLINDLINQYDFKKNTNDITYLNRNILFNEYYSVRNIRKRKINFEEEFFLIENSKEIIAFISFEVEHACPVATINLIHIKERYKHQFTVLFTKIIEELNSIPEIQYYKIRANVELEEYWSVFFESLNFQPNGVRKFGDNLENSYSEYVYYIK